jgi:hypothetical protein
MGAMTTTREGQTTSVCNRCDNVAIAIAIAHDGTARKETNLLLFLLALVTGKSLQLLLLFGFLLPLARRHDYRCERRGSGSIRWKRKRIILR